MLLAAEVGVTGLVVSGLPSPPDRYLYSEVPYNEQGSHILTTLLAQPSISAVHAYSRKKLSSRPKLTVLDNADSSAWPSIFPSNAP
ncbi:uncharacterized protein LDX57_000633 [Aspergillus melleus]|uniref:uncharacterized protein n=1 Tax=Aspergillus melleus TaxID=138277 RepID=UPI001E8E62D5|nr:uncharacterized protein LDX57_000633 [Aspergillus melleus]KAH8422880.1 hypothetical protein LDX57_000633 [Aspergillus melleus]